MSWMDQLGAIVQQYSGAGAAAAQAPDVHEHFDQVAQAAPPSVLADGIAGAFRSSQTPAFGEMVSNLFNQSDGQQKAGILNRLLASAGPGMLSQIPGLSGLLSSGQQITPQQAQQVPAQAVQDLATHAEKANPSIVDEVSGFYAQHPDVVKALGGLALSIALQKMVRSRG
jgi:hypothetical protein